MSKIKVLVCGAAASGTTTVAVAITKALNSLGLEVENTDPDVHAWTHEFPAEAAAAMKAKGTGIEVSVRQTRAFPVREPNGGEITFMLPADTTEEEAHQIVSNHYKHRTEHALSEALAITHICLDCYNLTTGGRPESWASLDEVSCNLCNTVKPCFRLQTAILKVRQGLWSYRVASGPVDDTVNDIIGKSLIED